MKAALVVLAVLLLAQTPAPPMPPPGNPGHQAPAPGAFCAHNDPNPAHTCSCQRECKQNTDDEGNPAPGGYVQEDPHCRAYCFHDHCHCPAKNCD